MSLDGKLSLHLALMAYLSMAIVGIDPPQKRSDNLELSPLKLPWSRKIGLRASPGRIVWGPA